MRLYLAFLPLAFAALACGTYVPTGTPVPSPTSPPPATATQPAAQIPPTPRPTGTADVAVVAEIVRPVVNYRDAAGGTVIGNLAAGDTVTVLGCIEEPDELAGWCEVEYKEQTFYIWQGCLSLETELLCQAE